MSEKPSKRAQIERLERENAALRRANASLMRDRLGSSNSAAASELAKQKPSGSIGGSLRAGLARLRLTLRRALLRLLR